MLKVTPFSQIANIIIFTIFSLSTRFFITPLLQIILIFTAYYIFKINIKDIHFKYYIPIIPIILFVFIINSFRGSGEIIVKLGPFVVVKQGIQRGYYYSFIIVILFIMSKTFTKGFNANVHISVLYSIGKAISNKMLFLKRPNANNNKDFLIVVYYIFKLFENTYSELKIFFKMTELSLRNRLICFLYSVFEKSEENYEELRSIEIKPTRPVSSDCVYIFFQISLCILIFIIGRSYKC